MQDLIAKYESVLAQYRAKVMDTMSQQDWYDYNEVLFSAHSCAIEGNSFSVNDTRELKEKGLGVIPQGKTLLEAFEILDHFEAYQYMLSIVGQPLCESNLKEMHRLCTRNTLTYRTHGEGVPGEYTTTDMAAGDTIFGDHEQLIARVPDLLSATQQAMDKAETHPVCIAARFHCFFEFLHPFRDGNGRTGRLMANLILLSMNHPMVIIPSEHKSEYIRALQMYKKEHSVEFIEHFFLSVAVARMERELNEKATLTARSNLRFFI